MYSSRSWGCPVHAEALEWVGRWAHGVSPLLVLDVGGRDINGNPDHLFHEDSTWHVVDLHAGPRVTWVGDFLDFGCVDRFDVVTHLEVAEHTAEWPEHLSHACHLLDPYEGAMVFTAAGPNRQPHSHVDGGALREGEYYENVDPDALSTVLDRLFARHVIDLTPDGTDVRAVAWR